MSDNLERRILVVLMMISLVSCGEVTPPVSQEDSFSVHHIFSTSADSGFGWILGIQRCCWSGNNHVEY